MQRRNILENEKIIITAKCTIDARDRGIKKLYREYKTYKREFLPLIQEAIREIVKDRKIKLYSQQKWMVDQKVTRYIKNLPLHPMSFHNQSVWINKNDKGWFDLHLKTGEGETTCHLFVPFKYRELIEKAVGKNNEVLGQVELIEDIRFGRINTHIVLRIPKPQPYRTEKYVGVDVGWNYLATSALVTHDKISDITFHGKDFKTKIIQLKYLLKQYQRSGRASQKWNYRLKNTIKNAVGKIAKELTIKAQKNKAGVAMENLSFRSNTKRWLIPRYKLRVAVKNLCERIGIPFIEVPARNTSITCSRCGHIDKASRNGKHFKCTLCNYTLNADLNAAVNIGRAAILMDYKFMGKNSRLQAEEEGEIATPINPSVPQEASPMRNG